jgi:cobalt-zinc-cadmium efflux system membrane fusion protein
MPFFTIDVTRRPRTVFALLALCLLLLTPAFAHEGHDHGAPQPLALAKASTRVTAQSEIYELVGILKHDTLRLYLDRFETNDPVTDATIVVTVGGEEEITASPLGDGTFGITSGRFLAEGALELVFAITSQSGDDLLIGTIDLLPSPATSASPPPSDPLLGLRHGPDILVAGFPVPQPYVFAGAALVLGIALGMAIRSRGTVMPVVTIGAIALVATTAIAFSHEGHDHGSGEIPAPSGGDAASRLSDGSVFVPKPTQRLLDVRTIVAKPEEAFKAVSLIGRVIADPNRSGLVQSINGGRILSPETGLPRLGQRVKKGDVLALVEQALSQADQTGIAEQIGAIEQEIAVAEAKLERASKLAERGVAAQSQVSDAETALAGLRRRLGIFAESRAEPETLRAPVDGVISAVNIVAGQVVGSEDTVFQIIDPAGLWVEALVYGQIDPAKLTGASAAALDGSALDLRFEGFSKTLQQQATRVQFAIVDPPGSLGVGQPVQVFARNGASVTAIVLPREAVLKGANGESLVWRHAEAERFEARAVRTEPFDANRLIVQAGIERGDRIVVSGSELINQVR